MAFPALLLYFLYRSIGSRAYWRSLPQRFGFVPHSYRQTGPGAIWLHAVSVGEVVSCREFLGRLRSELPHTCFFVSTSTLTGRATAEQKLTGMVDGIFYAPVDYAFAIRRVLRALKPSVVLVAETEIWPNLFRESRRTGASLAIVNGRISDRAFPRYRRRRWFFAVVLPAADAILAQSEEIAARFESIGAPPERVRVGGNFKYDFEARTPDPQSPVIAWLDSLRPAGVWVAASTMTDGAIDEDDAVIAAYSALRRAHPRLALILAPRKPERFDPAAAKLRAAGLDFWRRSAGGWAAESPPPVLLLDTIGELASLFSVADVVFMGGTLADRGGHNVLEPALFARPVIVGPHLENFRAIAAAFHAAGAYVEIEGPDSLAPAAARLLDDPRMAAEIGRRALACAQGSRGASARAAAAVRELYSRRIPIYRPAQPWYPLLAVLARVWRWGGARQREAALRAQRKLDLPVISVGNLSMGGTGKTPCVLRLAELLRERGRSPGILTRGYKRASPHQQLVLPPGAAVETAHSGDEPQIFVRAGVAPVGIGADRWATGMLLRRQFEVDVMLLDDGFQHVKLARNVDLVLIDALDPFGGGLFPLGRLREPPEALARAGMVLITRGRDSDLGCAIERAVRRWNPDAPVFRAFVEPREWVEHANGKRTAAADLKLEKPGVFCGLGNPRAFRLALREMGIEPAEWVDFEDHHRYQPGELRRVAHLLAARGALAAITTEKDAMNLPDSAADLLSPLPLYWLRVAMRVERESEFLAEIERRIG